MTDIQYGVGGGLTATSQYRGFSGAVSNPYKEAGVSSMPRSTTTVSLGLFQWVVGGLFAVLVALCGYYMSDLSGDVKNIRKDLSDARIEYAKAIGGVQTQIATTNTKLDGILQELQHQRR
jgi:hypothetical protein